MPQQRELHRKAQPIRIAAPRGQKLPIRSGEAVVPRQRVGIAWRAEQQPALLLGQQLSARHRLLPVPKPSIMIVDGGRLLDAFCGRKRAALAGCGRRRPENGRWTERLRRKGT